MNIEQRKQVLQTLYSRNELSSKKLAEEFKVTRRTIRKARKIELQDSDRCLERIYDAIVGRLL